MKKTIVTVLMLFVIFSCSKKTASTASQKPAEKPVEQSVNTTSATGGDMLAAESVYKETCGSCHKLPTPAKYTAAQWPSVVDRMQRKKQGFDDGKKLQILAYLSANAKP